MPPFYKDMLHFPEWMTSVKGFKQRYSRSDTTWSRSHAGARPDATEELEVHYGNSNKENLANAKMKEDHHQ